MRTRNQLNGDDNAGVLLCESYAGGPLNGLTVTNAYDELLRRTSVTILDTQSAILAATAYAYDQISGRLQVVSQGGASATNSYVANSQLVGQIDFAKDSSPVMTTTKQFDPLNRLTGISSVPSVSSAVSSRYAYNTVSQRVAITNADNTRWDFQSDIQSFTWGMDLSGSLQGPSGPGELANTLHFACNDGNGNIAALVNAADGTESARYDYGPFGEVLRATGLMAEANPIRFSTQYADDVTGDVKYLYRDYTPRMGRWLSRDPISERGGRNLYSFVRNNPIRHFDKYGHLGIPNTCAYGSMSKDTDGTPDGPITTTTPTMLWPAALLSLIDRIPGISITELDELDFFLNNPDAFEATSRAKQHFERTINGSKTILCRRQCPIVPSFFTGSQGELYKTTILKLEKSGGATPFEWPITQGLIWRIFVLNEAEYRLTMLNVSDDKKCCMNWDAEVSIVDKLGWERDKYGADRDLVSAALEAIFGSSREFVRGRFHVKGSVCCDGEF